MRFFVNSETYLSPPQWTRFGGSGKLNPTALKEEAAADFSDCVMIRESATSKD
jgi:hypothetical protein